MAHGSGDSLVLEYDETPRMKTKRKFDEELRNWDRDKAGVPAAPVPLCRNVRPPLIDVTQSIDDIVNRSFEKFKRSRMEVAGKGQIDLFCTDGDDKFKLVHDEPAKETFPMHREQDAQFYNGEGSNQPRKIDVPNLKASTEGAVIAGALDFGLKVRSNKGMSMSLNLTEEFVQLLHQVPTMNFAIKVESKESGESFQVSLNGVRDFV